MLVGSSPINAAIASEFSAGHHASMPPPELVAAHRKAQDAAKAVLRELAATIGADDTEESIASRATGALARYGIQDTWYHDCPALVLLGSRSCMSVSGRVYRPGVERVGQTNLVTIDLSPSHAGHWGDCARSFAVEQGRVSDTPSNAAFLVGVSFVRRLQAAMRQFVTPQTTFHELATWTAQQIDAAGFVNLDFRGNVGHSIATRRDDRVYIEAGNHRPLGEVSFFTFEPHVRAEDGTWGFKHEDIFFFDASGTVEEL
jgi:Xaa-Pro aminopeptidase